MTKIIEFKKRRNEILFDKLKKSGLLDYPDSYFLGYNIDLYVASHTDIKRESINIIKGLSKTQPFNWNFSFSNANLWEKYKKNIHYHPNLGYRRRQDENISYSIPIKNPQVLPISWMISDMETKGFLEHLTEFYFAYADKATTMKLKGNFNYCRPEDSITDIDVIVKNYPNLGKEIIKNDLTKGKNVLYPEIINFFHAIPILQDAARNIQYETGFWFLLKGNKKIDDKKRYDGVLMKPHEFSELTIPGLIKIKTDIENLCEYRQ